MSFWGTRPSPFTSNEVTFLQTLADHTFTDGQLIIGNTSTGGVGFATITAGSGITVTNAGGTITLSASGGAASLVVGTSTITSGTTTRILYDNAGVLGEYTISGTGTVVAMATSPSFTTPTLGVATATSINKMAITAPATSSTLAVADGKTFTVSNTITLAGTDAQTYTFPTTSATIARTDAANTFTGTQTITTIAGLTTVTGAASNMTITAGTGNSRTMILQTTTSGGAATTALTLGADQSATFAGHLVVEGVTSTGATGTGKFVFDGSPTLVTAALGSSTATTQAPADNSTKVATTAYVDNAVLGQRYKEAVKYASIAALPSIVYANGSSGVGATLTGVALAAISLDSSSPAVNDRVLIKNQASDFQNGIYIVTATGSGIAVFVLTRATDFDQASDIQTGDTVFVTAGSTLANTTWTYTGIDSPTMGTTSLTFTQAAGPGSYTQGAGITITGVSIAVTAPVTVALGGTNATSASITAFNNITGYSASGATGTTSTNLVFSTSPTLVTPLLGTPTSGTLTNTTGYLFNNLANPTGALSLALPAGDEVTFTFSATTQTGFLKTSTTLTTGIIQKNSITGSSAVASAASSGSLLTLTSAGTGFTTATQRLGAIYSTGANSNATVVLQGLDISIANTGTTNTNQALRLSASGGSTTNIAVDLAAGELRLAGSAGTSGQILISGGTNASPSWTSTPTVTTLTTTGNIELGNASDTTIARVSAGLVSIEGSNIGTMAAAQVWTGQNKFNNLIDVNNAIAASSNAATVPVTFRLNTVTNSSAATLTITMTTTSAVDGQMTIVRILDFSAVAQTITWVNTENSTVTAPATSNGSTTLFLTVGFIYNSGTSKWRCIASA